jgi:hypothetical protein
MKINGKRISKLRKDMAQLRKLGNMKSIGLEKMANITTKLRSIETTTQNAKATMCRRLNGLIMIPTKVNKTEHAIERFKPNVKLGTIG